MVTTTALGQGTLIGPATRNGGFEDGVASPWLACKVDLLNRRALEKAGHRQRAAEILAEAQPLLAESWPPVIGGDVWQDSRDI